MQQADLSLSISKVSVEGTMFGGDRPLITRLIDHSTSGTALFLATMHTELTAVRGKEADRYDVYYSINFSSPRTSPAFIDRKQEIVTRLSSESAVNSFLHILKEEIEEKGIGSSELGKNIFFVATIEPFEHNAFASIIRFGFGRSGEVTKSHFIKITHSTNPQQETPPQDLEDCFVQKLLSIDIAADLVPVREKAES